MFVVMMIFKFSILLRRSFDDGLSECGLICPNEILAIDGRLDPFYSRDQPKGKKLPMSSIVAASLDSSD
jgi:hypothetical protein